MNSVKNQLSGKDYMSDEYREDDENVRRVLSSFSRSNENLLVGLGRRWRIFRRKCVSDLIY